jgi:hypothetical protein
MLALVSGLNLEVLEGFYCHLSSDSGTPRHLMGILSIASAVKLSVLFLTSYI